MTYAFVLDASACTGCKACQLACKDKNVLGPGILWRRVYEVSGGSWKQEGEAWSNTVFAYNLSLSCNHCAHPKCAGVCPVDAYVVRENGIVVLDARKCIGCGYCAWACPYDAPQYDAAAGRMTKCDFCSDNLDAGLPPACVSACPLRVLDYAEVEDGRAPGAGQVALWQVPAREHPYPMPESARTQPHLAIKPHPAMRSADEKVTANEEEVRPQAMSARREGPLVGFTLLVQMAVGGLWAMFGLFGPGQPPLLPLVLVGLCLGAGQAISFGHLGSRRNAWRVLSHLRKSWLSREILFTILFGAGWLAMFAAVAQGKNLTGLGWSTALIGFGLVHCMSQVYRLRTVPAWDSGWTEARFLLPAALLGMLGMVPLVLDTGRSLAPWARGVILMLLLAQAALTLRRPFPAVPRGIQPALMIGGLMTAALLFCIPGWLSVPSSLLLLAIVLAEQMAGRWQFYQARASSRIARM